MNKTKQPQLQVWCVMLTVETDEETHCITEKMFFDKKDAEKHCDHLLSYNDGQKFSVEEGFVN